MTVHKLDPLTQERTTKLKGIAWWVNKRLVGEPSWEGLDGPGQYLDGRSTEARRFSFVAEADILKEEKHPDWTGFKDSEKVKTTDMFICSSRTSFGDCWRITERQLRRMRSSRIGV